MLAGLGAIVPSVVPAALALALALAVYRWHDIALQMAVIVVLAVRPSLDAFSVRRPGFGPFHLNPAVLCGMFVLIVASSLAVRRARLGQPWWPEARLRAAHVWLFASYGIGLLSGWRLYDGPGFEQGLREMVRVLSVVGGFLLLLWWVEQDHLRSRRGWVWLVIGLVPPASVAIWQLVTGNGYREPDGLNRLQGTFSHPNSFGPYLVPFVLAAVGSAIASRGLARWWRIIAAAGLTGLVTLTFSRTALLLLLVGLLLLPALQAHGFGMRAVLRATIVVVSLLAIGWLLEGNLIRQRFAVLSSDTPLLEVVQVGAPENSLQWRIMNWAVLVRLGMASPVTGHGTGMTEVLNPIVNQNTGIPFNAHNDFVRLFFETGLLGLTCYLIYGLLLAMWALQTARRVALADAPTSFAVVSAFVSMFFLTVGTTELSLQTALQYELYGMLAMVAGSVKHADADVTLP